MNPSRKHWLKWLAGGLFVLIAIGLLPAINHVRERNEFSRLQKQGMAIILSFEEVRPASEPAAAWRNQLVEVHNVWGNVVYQPAWVPSETVAELVRELRQIRESADSGNVVGKIDLIFQQLLRVRPQQSKFIQNYREAFRAARAGAER